MSTEIYCRFTISRLPYHTKGWLLLGNNIIFVFWVITYYLHLQRSLQSVIWNGRDLKRASHWAQALALQKPAEPKLDKLTCDVMTEREQLYTDRLRGTGAALLRGSVCLPGEKVELLMCSRWMRRTDWLTVQEFHEGCWLQRCTRERTAAINLANTCYHSCWRNRCEPGWLSRYSDWLRTGWTAEWIPGGGILPAPVQAGAGARLASCTMITGSRSREWSGRCVLLTAHPIYCRS